MYKAFCTLAITACLYVSLLFTLYPVSATQPLTATGVIRGNVTDLAGQPLNTVKVIAYVYDQAGEWQEGGFGFTDQTGTYLITGLAAGRYQIGFFPFAPYRFGYTLHKSEYYNNATTLVAATELLLAEGETVEQIDAQLQPKARIQGDVTNLAGEPLAAIYVRIYTGPDSQGRWRIPTGYIGIVPLFHLSDGEGWFDLPGLDEGQYRLAFSHYPEIDPTKGAIEYYDNAAHFEAATIITVMSNTLTTTITTDLAVPTGYVRGRVTSTSGDPLAGIRVIANNSWRYVYTDATGYYTLTGVPVGDTAVAFVDVTTPRQQRQWATGYYQDSDNLGDATTIAVQEGQTRDGIDAVLTSLGRIQGRVVDRTGAPLAGIRVTFFASTAYPVDSTVTTVEGQFTHPLDHSDYKIGYQDTFEPARFLPLYYPAAATLEEASLVTVTNGISLTADAQLVALRELTEHSYFPLIKAENETTFPVDHAPDKNGR